jgi:hypothetical protein
VTLCSLLVHSELKRYKRHSKDSYNGHDQCNHRGDHRFHRLTFLYMALQIGQHQCCYRIGGLHRFQARKRFYNDQSRSFGRRRRRLERSSLVHLGFGGGRPWDGEDHEPQHRWRRGRRRGCWRDACWAAPVRG